MQGRGVPRRSRRSSGLSRRRVLSLAGAALGTAALGVGLPGSAAKAGGAPAAWTAPHGLPPRLPGWPLVCEIPTPRPEIALTFDDGPHPTLTPALLDVLRDRGVRATFYVVGWRVLRWPDIARRIVAEGHEIGNHSWRHDNLAAMGAARLLRDLDRASDAIRQVVGRPPVTLRPPYGALSPRQQRLVWDERRLPTVMWSVDPLDWQRPGSGTVARRIVARSQPGAIVLAHDIHGPTIRAVLAILDGLSARGLRLRTVSELLGAVPFGLR